MSGLRAAWTALGGLAMVAVGACGNDEGGSVFSGLATTTTKATTTTEASLVEAPAGYTQDQADAWAADVTGHPDMAALIDENGDRWVQVLLESATTTCDAIDTAREQEPNDMTVVLAMQTAIDENINSAAASVGRSTAETMTGLSLAHAANHLCPQHGDILAAAFWNDPSCLDDLPRCRAENTG